MLKTRKTRYCGTRRKGVYLRKGILEVNLFPMASGDSAYLNEAEPPNTNVC
jgi:hypothetical protein